MTQPRLYVPVFTATLLLSAFLLFDVQPMFGKMILPLLGGSPGVWNTAMVFFQALLLGGYVYAHLLARYLPPRAQLGTHIVALLFFGLALPLAIPAGWEPPATDNPAFWQLKLMTVAAGGPFFILAASAPLLQHWFSRTDHPDAHNPYFLYAASNVGSLAALLLYPIAIEPLLTLRQQSLMWAGGYGALALMIVLCGLMTLRARNASEAVVADDAPPTAGRIGLWLLLAFVPSSLMLGLTTFVTTDLASAPLIWVIPLAIYVGTFVIAFARQWPVKLNTVLLWQGVFLVIVIALFVLGAREAKLTVMAAHLALFTLTALFCHMQLAALRPGPRHLTQFYLVMSLGGMMGGIFNALLAPQLFVLPAEYALVLALSGFLRYLADPGQTSQRLLAKWKTLRTEGKLRTVAESVIVACSAALICTVILMLPAGQPKTLAVLALSIAMVLAAPRRWLFAVMAALILFIHPGFQWHLKQQTLELRRNFFGVMRVFEDPVGLRLFSHGTTLHGAQPRDKKLRLTPVSYYYKGGPAGQVFTLLNSRPGKQRIAGLGLGIGSIACFARKDRSYDFYEIDPDVAEIAEDKRLFTYLSDCGSPYRIVIGDARLKIEQAPDHSYDMIFVDTFSSDNIPVHLITREAFALYLQKLKPGGMIAVNISNRHLALEPVIAAAARDLNLAALFKSKRGGYVEGTKMPYAPSIFAVLAPRPQTLKPLEKERWHAWDIPVEQKAWRDDFSNIAGAIRWTLPHADE